MADPVTPTPAVDAHNYNLGRDFITPPQVDDKGNSIITGEKTLTSNALFQTQQAAVSDPNMTWEPNVSDFSLVPSSKTPDPIIEISKEEAARRKAEFLLNMENIWVGNHDDLKSPDVPDFQRTEGVHHNEVRPVDQPDFAWNPLKGADEYVAPPKMSDVDLKKLRDLEKEQADIFNLNMQNIWVGSKV